MIDRSFKVVEISNNLRLSAPLRAKLGYILIVSVLYDNVIFTLIFGLRNIFHTLKPTK